MAELQADQELLKLKYQELLLEAKSYHLKTTICNALVLVVQKITKTQLALILKKYINLRK